MWPESTTTSQVSCATSTQSVATKTTKPNGFATRSKSSSGSSSNSTTSWTMGRRLSLVWKVPRESYPQVMGELLDRMQTLASFCWEDPTALLGASGGYQLSFEMTYDRESQLLLLTLYPSPQEGDSSSA